MEIKDDILYIYYKKGLKFTLEISKDLVSTRLKFINGQTYPAIVFDEGVLSIDQASKEFFTSDLGISGIKSVAFIQGTFFSRMVLGLFTLRQNHLKIPVQAFSSLIEAQQWSMGK